MFVYGFFSISLSLFNISYSSQAQKTLKKTQNLEPKSRSKKMKSNEWTHRNMCVFINVEKKSCYSTVHTSSEQQERRDMKMLQIVTKHSRATKREAKKTVAICVSFAVLWIKICVMKIKMCIHFCCDRVVRRWKKMCAFGQLTKLVHEISFNATTIQFHWIHKFPTFIALKLHFNRRHSRKKQKQK